jgi:DNA-binding CsgD family transcriptional regulator
MTELLSGSTDYALALRSPAPLALVEPWSLRLVAASEQLADVLGVDASSLARLELTVFVAADQRPLLRGVLAGVAAGLVDSCHGRWRWQRADDQPVDLLTSLQPFGEDGLVLLAVMPSAAARTPAPPQATETTAQRAARLEGHLWRIGLELQSAGSGVGVLPASPLDDAVRGLSPRQVQILRCLLRGERSSRIARELSLRESTVRNHLSAIYRRLRVHSQAELLALCGGRLPSRA